MRIEKEMIIEGILSINDCENPLVIKEKLMPFIEMQEHAGKKAADFPKHNTVKEETVE
jgi:flagellar motor component MotA